MLIFFNIRQIVHIALVANSTTGGISTDDHTNDIIGQICSERQVNLATASSNSIGAIIGVLIAIFVVVLVITVFTVIGYYRRKMLLLLVSFYN